MAAIVHFVCLHSRTLKEAAQILEMDEKTLRKLRRELGVEWTRPMKRFAPTSPPSEWWRELMQFLRSASRAGRPIELPDELLIQWVGQRPQLRRQLASSFEPLRPEWGGQEMVRRF